MRPCGILPPVDETREEWKARMGIGAPSLATQRYGDGSTVTKPVPNDDKPGLAGAITEHWSGRQDASVFPETVALRGKTQEIGR